MRNHPEVASRLHQASRSTVRTRVGICRQGLAYGHATRLPVADLHVHILVEKLGGRVDSMTFDHGETHVDYSDGEKSDAKTKPNSA